MEAIYGGMDQDYDFWDNKTWQLGMGEMYQSLTPAASENGVSSNNMFTSIILFGKLRIYFDKTTGDCGQIKTALVSFISFVGFTMI